MKNIILLIAALIGFQTIASAQEVAPCASPSIAASDAAVKIEASSGRYPLAQYLGQATADYNVKKSNGDFAVYEVIYPLLDSTKTTTVATLTYRIETDIQKLGKTGINVTCSVRAPVLDNVDIPKRFRIK